LALRIIHFYRATLSAVYARVGQGSLFWTRPDRSRYTATRRDPNLFLI